MNHFDEKSTHSFNTNEPNGHLYPFQLKAEPGIRLGYSLQRLLATAPSSTGSGQLQIPRGATIPTSASSSSSQKAAEKSIAVDPSVQARPLAINHSVYSLLQGNRQHRRSLLTSLVTLFDLDHVCASPSALCFHLGTVILQVYYCDWFLHHARNFQV